MAYTKIHPIKATVSKAIAYICSPDKTDGNLLVSSYACSPESAAADFKFALSKTKQSDPNKAYHLIQSFVPGEVSPEEAHRVGEEYARRLLGDKYSYIVATHIDKAHVHNHIIFCAADNYEHKKYHDCKQSYYHLCKVSNEICEEHGLSVIRKKEHAAKSYKEWAEEKKGTSWKAGLRTHINECVRKSRTYEDFLGHMRALGYEIQGESFGEGAPKYISFRAPGKSRFIRGRANSLGADYTKERIRERIEEKARLRAERMKRFVTPQVLLDTASVAKYEEDERVRKWADLQNLKRASAMYAELNRLGFQSQEQLDERIFSLEEQSQESRKTVKALEKKIHDLSEISYFAGQYKENRKFHIRYRKSVDPERYYQNHATELTLYGGAKQQLKKFGIDPEKDDLEGLQASLEAMRVDKQKLSQQCKSLNREAEKLRKIKAGLNSYLNAERQPAAPEHGTDISHESLYDPACR